MPRNDGSSMNADLALAGCLARTLHEMDDTFLKTLKQNVRIFLAEEPPDSSARNVLMRFQALLDEPVIFAK